MNLLKMAECCAQLPDDDAVLDAACDVWLGGIQTIIWGFPVTRRHVAACDLWRKIYVQTL